MDASDLALFAEVAHTGCISKAAINLNTVQSNVTQRVQLLEDELGVPLFYRHSRGVTLTTAGGQLLPYAERIARLVGEAKQAAMDGPVPHGQISIGAMETATALRLPPLLSAYASRYPDVDIEINTGPTAGLIEQVLERHIEAGFVAGPLEHPELLAIPVIQEELVVVTAPWIRSLPALAGNPQGGVKIIVFRSGCSYRVRLENLLAARGIVALRRLELGSLDGIVGCVAAGIGLTLLPRIVVEQSERDGRVAIHRLPAHEAQVQTVLVRRRDAFVSTALGSFIEMAADYFHQAHGEHALPREIALKKSSGRERPAAHTSHSRASASGAERLRTSL
ncbi:MAG: LysR family transcriptional regulator [Terriglobales bacterium]